MALTEQVILDIQSAQRQIDQLERQLNQLATPINVPVDVDSSGDINRVTSELRQADTSVENLNRELNQTDDALRSAGTAARRTGDDIDTVGRKGTTAFGSLNTAVGKLGLAFGAAAVGAGFIRFAGDAIEAASDLEESISKSTVVFGTFNDEIQDFASTAPQALGLSTSAAVEFTATFGNLFVALGLSQQAAAELSPEIVQLGSDLASFNNIEVTEALDKLRAGLVGEAEPLRVLGVNLTAATTEAKAFELGLGGVTGELTEAEKVQARYALILEQTQTAQGDFARTADGLANTQRTLTAEWENAQAIIGQALVPAVQGVIPILVTLAETLGVIGIEFGIAFGNIEAGAGRLQQLALQSGQAAGSATLLAGAVLDLQDNLNLVNSTSDEFRKTNDDLITGIEDLVSAWGGTSTETQTLIDNLDLLVEEFGLTEEAAEALRLELEQRRNTAFAEQEDVALLGNLARVFVDVRDAAREVTGPVEAFKVTMADLGRIGSEGTFGDITGIFDQLPNELEAAAAALRGEENEIIPDFTTFLANLEDELTARQVFSDNLAILESLGLDNLADVFTEAGLEAAGALADAVANPEEARRAEELLDEQARLNAISVLDEFRSTLVSGFDALGLQFDIPVYPILQPLNVNASTGFVLPPLGVPVGSGGGGGTTVINNNFTSPQIPPNEVSRTQQVVSAVVGNQR